MQNFIFFIVLLLSASLHAAEPTIKGNWIQGGLLHGKTEAQNKIFILGQSAFVSDDGEFVFGLGRDTPNKVILTVELPSGQKQEYTYAVKQREYRTQRIEGVAKKYVAPPKEVTQRIQSETAQVKKARKNTTQDNFFSQGFDWPLHGPITGVYGSQRIFNGVPKRPHFGLDIAGPVGAKVTAPAPGVVRLAHDNMYYSGGTLIVDHGQGVSSTFIHLSKILVKEGEKVATGELIAEVGAGGRATGPHLDWRVNWFDQRLDPAFLLPELPESSSNPSK